MKLFQFDGPLMTLLRKLWSIIIAGVLFLVCCIPVFTAGASFTALYEVTEKNLKNDRGYVLRGFIDSLRENWRQTLPAGAVFAAVFLLLETDVRLMKAFLENGHDFGNAYILFRVFDVLLFAYAVWVFTQIACFKNRLRQILKNALLLSVRHLGASVLILLLAAAGAAIIWVMPVTVVIMPVLVTWFITAILSPVFGRYSDKPAETGEDSGFSQGVDSEGDSPAENDEDNNIITETGGHEE